MKHPAPAAALLCAAAIAGCGGSSKPTESGARATVQRYFAAVAAQRAGDACAELTDRSRQRLADAAVRLHATGCEGAMGAVFRSPYGRALERLAHPQITSLVIHGNRATAQVDGVDAPLALVADGGDWRIEFSPPPAD